MDIAQKVSEWLAAHNKDMARKINRFSSFYEEMEARNKAEIEEKELSFKEQYADLITFLIVMAC